MDAAERDRLVPALWDVRSFLLGQGEGGRAQACEDAARRLEEDAAADAEAEAAKKAPKAAVTAPAASAAPSAAPAKG